MNKEHRDEFTSHQGVRVRFGFRIVLHARYSLASLRRKSRKRRNHPHDSDSQDNSHKQAPRLLNDVEWGVREDKNTDQHP